jgi:hypothetical protein
MTSSLGLLALRSYARSARMAVLDASAIIATDRLAPASLV